MTNEQIKDGDELKTLDLFMKIAKCCPEIEKILKVGYILNGIQGFVKTKNGNAYEIIIKSSYIKGKY